MPLMSLYYVTPESLRYKQQQALKHSPRQTRKYAKPIHETPLGAGPSLPLSRNGSIFGPLASIPEDDCFQPQTSWMDCWKPLLQTLQVHFDNAMAAWQHHQTIQATASARHTPEHKSLRRYFQTLTHLRDELFDPKKQPPQVLPGSYQKEQSETLWRLPTVIRQADIVAANHKRYHLQTEEVGDFETRHQPAINTYPTGTLLKMALTRSNCHEKLTHEIWPRPAVIHEKTRYTTPQGETVSRTYAQLKHSGEKPKKTAQDAALRQTLLEPLHALLKEQG